MKNLLFFIRNKHKSFFVIFMKSFKVISRLNSEVNLFKISINIKDELYTYRARIFFTTIFINRYSDLPRKLKGISNYLIWLLGSEV